MARLHASDPARGASPARAVRPVKAGDRCCGGQSGGRRRVLRRPSTGTGHAVENASFHAADRDDSFSARLMAREGRRSAPVLRVGPAAPRPARSAVRGRPRHGARPGDSPSLSELRRRPSAASPASRPQMRGPERARTHGARTHPFARRARTHTHARTHARTHAHLPPRWLSTAVLSASCSAVATELSPFQQ